MRVPTPPFQARTSEMLPAMAADLRPFRLPHGPRLQLDLGHAGHGGEGLAAKAERVPRRTDRRRVASLLVA